MSGFFLQIFIHKISSSLNTTKIPLFRLSKNSQSLVKCGYWEILIPPILIMSPKLLYDKFIIQPSDHNNVSTVINPWCPTSFIHIYPPYIFLVKNIVRDIQTKLFRKESNLHPRLYHLSYETNQ